MSFLPQELTKAQVDGLLAALNAREPKKFYSAQWGKKNIRIVQKHFENDEHGSCFCFLGIATGYILKAAGWKAPAPYARGTIHTPTFGAEYLDSHGARYLR
jgi:hypothetical protein